MDKTRGVYHRKDGRWEARYKKGVGANGRAIYGAVYGSTPEEVVRRRAQVIEERQSTSTELNLLILGAGNHGHDVKEVAEALHIFHSISFLDDYAAGPGIVGKCTDAPAFQGQYACAFVAIGNNKKRKEYAEFLRKNRFLIPKLISPSAVISPNAVIGEGTAILAQATVGAATIGQFCILAQNSIVNSSARLFDYSHVDTGGIVAKCAVLEECGTVRTGEVLHRHRSMDTM